MLELQKRLKLSSSQVIQLSLRYFGILSKHKTAFISMVIFITIFKNYIKHRIDRIKKLIKENRTEEEMKLSFIRAFLFNTHWAAMNFLTDFIFEKQLTPYGGFLAVKVLKQMLLTDSRAAHETQGSEFEYYITEGGKSLAKISRYIIFSFISKICHFAFGLLSVLEHDITDKKIATKIFLLGLVTLSIYKYSKLKKITEFNKITMDVA